MKDPHIKRSPAAPKVVQWPRMTPLVPHPEVLPNEPGFVEVEMVDSVPDFPAIGANAQCEELARSLAAQCLEGVKARKGSYNVTDANNCMQQAMRQHCGEVRALPNSAKVPFPDEDGSFVPAPRYGQPGSRSGGCVGCPDSGPPGMGPPPGSIFDQPRPPVAAGSRNNTALLLLAGAALYFFLRRR